MDKKFEKVPHDSDTRTLGRKVITFNEIEALHERWFSEGIKGESLIFANEDVDGIDEEELKAMLTNSPLFKAGSGVTFKRAESGFTFINFNFKIV